MELLGMLLLTASAAYIGISKANELKCRAETLRELIAMLEMLRCEICTRHTPVKKALSLIPQDSRRALAFAESLSDSLDKLGEKSFGMLWNDSINAALCILTPTQKALLSQLGGSIGRYSAELQSAAIERCMQGLGREYEKLSAALISSRKMYIGIGTGTGLILSIVLL